MSHLTRGAWIEIQLWNTNMLCTIGRTSHEVRGLKYFQHERKTAVSAVAPHTRCVD